MSWLDVLEVFARNNSNIVPILDDTNKYIGYYEITDVVKFLNGTPFLKEVANPKSVSLILIDFESELSCTSKFSGLRSLCIMFFLCM